MLYVKPGRGSGLIFISISLLSLKILFNKKVPKNPEETIIPNNRIFAFRFRDLIFLKLEPNNRVGLQNIRN